MQQSGGEDKGRIGAEDYVKLLEREPNSLRFAEYADRLRGAKQLQEAAALCEQGLARHPGYATGHVVMAEIRLDSGDLERVEAELHEALRLDPFHPRAHAALGTLLLNRGETDRAVAEFETALLYSPGLHEAKTKLAEIRGKAAEEPHPLSPPRPTTSLGVNARRGGGEPENGRKPGERPTWLTTENADDLISLIWRCTGVDNAHIVDKLGDVIASSRADSAGGERAKAAVGLTEGSRGLASRLGAGRVRSALVRGKETQMLCVPLGELVLVADLRPGCDADESARQMEAAISEGPEMAEVASHA